MWSCAQWVKVVFQFPLSNFLSYLLLISYFYSIPSLLLSSLLTKIVLGYSCICLYKPCFCARYEKLYQFRWCITLVLKFHRALFCAWLSNLESCMLTPSAMEECFVSWRGHDCNMYHGEVFELFKWMRIDLYIQGGPERMQHLRSITSRKRGTEWKSCVHYCV